MRLWTADEGEQAQQAEEHAEAAMEPGPAGPASITFGQQRTMPGSLPCPPLARQRLSFILAGVAGCLCLLSARTQLHIPHVLQVLVPEACLLEHVAVTERMGCK